MRCEGYKMDDEKVSKEELKLERIRKVKQESEQVLKSLKVEDYHALVSDCYTEADAYIDMCVNNISFGCIIESMGGLGKTFRAINMCLQRDIEFAYTDSYTTPTAFYVWLYNNRNAEVLIIDDVAGLFNNDKVLAMLKGALWEVNGKRIVNYMTTKPLQDSEGNYVPTVCEVNARIIIITNHLNKKNPHIDAILSRVNYCFIEVNRDELLKILGQIVKNPYDDLSLDERKEVFDYLVENTSESTMNLNIRSLFKMFQFKLYSKRVNKPELWKNLSLLMFKKDDRLVVVENLIMDDSYSNEEERVNKFIEIFPQGGSRPTYFRLKKQLEKQKLKGG